MACLQCAAEGIDPADLEDRGRGLAVFKTVARPASWSRVGSTPMHLRHRILSQHPNNCSGIWSIEWVCAASSQGGFSVFAAIFAAEWSQL